MSTNVNNVTVGKPKIGGAVFRASIGSELPTSAKSALGGAYKDMGYVSADGVSNSKSRTTTDIKAWGGDIVLNPQTEKKDTFKIKFIEALNKEVLKAAHGEDNVTGDLESELVIRENAKELDYGVWIIDEIMSGNALKRIVIPNGKVTEIGDIVYKDDEAVGYDLTITAYPDSSIEGDTHREYITIAGDDSESDEGDN